MTRSLQVLRVVSVLLLLCALASSSRPLAQGQSVATATLQREFSAAAALEHRGDYAGAFALYQKAAAAGHLDSQNALAYMYDNGLGTRPDHAKALYWWKRAADFNHGGAQRNVAMWYMRFEGGIEQNGKLVREWFQKSAAQGYLPATFDLGKLLAYRMLDGSDEGQLEGLRLIQQAAQPGRDYLAVREAARKILPEITAHIKSRGILRPPPKERPSYCMAGGYLNPIHTCPGLVELSEPGPRAQCLQRQREMETECKQFR